MNSTPSSLPHIGLGWDTHRLEAGQDCILGGVLLDSPVGPVGHSDGDALLHALTDALLGAAGLDDIGTLFPDTYEENKNRDSADFVKAAMHAVQQNGLQVASVDCVLICDEPRLGPYRPAIRARMAKLLHLCETRVNLKGKTTEGGDAKRITVQVVVLLVNA